MVGPPLSPSDYGYTPDYLGLLTNKGKKKLREGKATTEEDHYVFSDGNGTMSQQFAARMASLMKYDGCVPSCFQTRFRGFKGIQVMDPFLDRRTEWAVERGMRPGKNLKTEEENFFEQILFRKSQEKFETEPVSTVVVSGTNVAIQSIFELALRSYFGLV